MRASSIAIVIVAASASSSCFDPVHDRAVENLGGERPGVKEGPTHRPGQPCTTCHGGDGPADPEFAFAGTIYAERGRPIQLQGVTISLTDSNGVTKEVFSNVVGNFYLDKLKWESVRLPVFVELEYGGKKKRMLTRIGRERSCAGCHYGSDDDPTHMPPVYFEEKRLPP